jgi:hypothetical protein
LIGKEAKGEPVEEQVVQVEHPVPVAKIDEIREVVQLPRRLKLRQVVFAALPIPAPAPGFITGDHRSKAAMCSEPPLGGRDVGGDGVPIFLGVLESIDEVGALDGPSGSTGWAGGVVRAQGWQGTLQQQGGYILGLLVEHKVIGDRMQDGGAGWGWGEGSGSPPHLRRCPRRCPRRWRRSPVQDIVYHSQQHIGPHRDPEVMEVI